MRRRRVRQLAGGTENGFEVVVAVVERQQRMVEGVEGREPELQPLPLGDLKAL